MSAEVFFGEGDVCFPVVAGDGVFAGAAIEAVTTRGFGGPIKVMVGFRPDGTIHNTAVISHTETPGLGDKMDPRKSDFSLQFQGKNPGTFRLAVKSFLQRLQKIV